jgi:hypothetical protein
LFLQSPANPDLMYIIMFSHTQLTTTLLLVLIFGSKVFAPLSPVVDRWRRLSREAEPFV